MSDTVLALMVLGAVVGAGVLCVVIGLSDHEPAPLRATVSWRDRLQGNARRALFGVGAGLAILLLTSWPVLAVAVGLLVWFAPRLFGGAGKEKRKTRLVEALACCEEPLGATVGAAGVLEAILPTTNYAAAPPIRAP